MWRALLLALLLASPVLAGAPELAPDTGLKGAGAGGTGGVYSLADLKTCIEATAPLDRTCTLAPGTYDGTISASISANTTSLTILAFGALIKPTGAVPTTDGHKSVFYLSFGTAAHDHQVALRGLRVQGSTAETDEELITFYMPEGTAGGKLLLDTLEVGEDVGAMEGTEKAFVFYGGTPIEQGYVSNSMFQSRGHVFDYSNGTEGTAGAWFSLSNVILRGYPSSHRRDTNLCMKAKVTHYLKLSSVSAQDCGGFDFTGSVNGDITTTDIGMGNEDAPLITQAGGAMNLDLTFASSSIEGGTDGPVFQFAGGSIIPAGTAVNVRVVDAKCSFFSMSTDHILFEMDPTSELYNDWDVHAEVGGQKSYDNPAYGCRVTPFGPNWLASLEQTTARGSAHVSAFGEIYEYANGGSQVHRRRLDSEPFMWRATRGGAANLGIPIYSIGYDTLTTALLGCLSSLSANASCSGDELTFAFGVPNLSRPIYLNEFTCSVSDQDVVGKNEDDAVDVILQKRIAATGAWEHVTTTPNALGRARFVEDEFDTALGRMLSDIGYVWTIDTPYYGAGDSVVIPAGEVDLFRVLAQAMIDTGGDITYANSDLSVSCTLKGWN